MGASERAWQKTETRFAGPLRMSAQAGFSQLFGCGTCGYRAI